MEVGMSRRIKPKDVRISMKEIWRNLDSTPKKLRIVELRSEI